MDLPSVAQDTERPRISAGHLPAPEVVRKHLTDTCQRRMRCLPRISRWAPSLAVSIRAPVNHQKRG
jgi:hypothetical protein